ncbi:MAG: LTA synthase family protein [Ruminococcus sp.]|nr:LTA synthase family protein [Ruminococcus sp.]
MADKSIEKVLSTGSKSKMSDVADKMPEKSEPSAEKKVRFKKIRIFNEKRDERTDKFKKLNLILLILFPLFILSMTEIIQGKSVSRYIDMWSDHFLPMLFGLIITYLIFTFFLAVFKKGWLATLVESILFVALATTERFKYNTNGNHLIISDMKLFRSVKSLTSFAYIKITWDLVLCYLIVIAFFFLILFFNPKVKWKAIPRTAIGAVFILISFGFVMCRPFYKNVYSAFDIDTTYTIRQSKINEKFDNNGFIGFLLQTLSEDYEHRIKEPENYSKKHIKDIQNDAPVIAAGNFNNGKKPNVIYIMSESFADFRVFDELKDDISSDVYKKFDNACEAGVSRRIITPTYASWTVRAEFELLFGLPSKGLNDPNMPQREYNKDHDLPALAQYYKSWGYNTAYIHPFQASFYGRKNTYPLFGFDELYFHDDQSNESDFTVEVGHYGTYVEDSTVYNQIVDLLNSSDEPMYIHTTTMQNHQPYNLGEDPDDEFGNYLQWIQHSNDALEVFLKQLENVEEPTLVFFVGDHFPSLRNETSVYNRLDLTEERESLLYEQTCFFWSNYDADFSKVPEGKFSFFYVPYVILDVIDAPNDAFIKKMTNYLKELPIYSTAYDPSIENVTELDDLTYDRVIGDLYSDSPVTDED